MRLLLVSRTKSAKRYLIRYTEDLENVRNEVLAFRSSIPVERVSSLDKRVRFYDPYHLRAAGPKEVICFPKENEVREYLAFFNVGL